MINFAMEIDIRFNREIDKTKDFISLGGYEMVMSGKNVCFDFNESESTIDAQDRSVLHCVLKHPDRSSFPVLKTISVEDLRNVTEIVECYIYPGEGDETDLREVEIEELAFIMADGEVIRVANNILKVYGRKVNESNRF